MKRRSTRHLTNALQAREVTKHKEILRNSDSWERENLTTDLQWMILDWILERKKDLTEKRGTNSESSLYSVATFGRFG